MFSTIVVGVDGHEGGRDALALAQSITEAAGGWVVAAHVHADEPFFLRGPTPVLETRDAAYKLLGRELVATGVAGQKRATADAFPARGIQRIAQDLDADLIIVGSPHRGPVGRVVAGDVARGVLKGASCPVMVARHRDVAASSLGRVVGVGYDGSPESRVALDWAARLAEAIDGTVRVLCVAEPAEAFTPSVSYGINWVGRGPEHREQAERLAAEAVAELGDRATAETVVGLPHDELVRLSHDVDLLVLGSRGYGPLRRTLLGSTSDGLVHAAACPVVVVPRAAHEEERADRSTPSETATT
jgi:nucleotide-binding universal stress UspA family protein